MSMATEGDGTSDTGTRDELTLRERITDNPRPALTWVGVAAALVAVEFGAFLGGVMLVADAVLIGTTGAIEAFVGAFAPGLAATIHDLQQSASGFFGGIHRWASDLPTLLSRDVIPNQGHRTGPSGGWEGTFLGLQPAYAWAIRVALVTAYVSVVCYWLFRGWVVFRDHYRQAEWTPRDDVVDRLRDHRWGQFGIVVIVAFLTMALFGPALSPTTAEQNIESSYGNEVQYFNEESGEVESVVVGTANLNSKSNGPGGNNVGPLSYDDYGRFHPFGTNVNGTDLFTYLMVGARLTMTIAALAIVLMSVIAVIMSMISSFYGGVADLAAVLVSDGITSVPLLLLLMMVEMAFREHWLSGILHGGFLLALVFGLANWPTLWRALRGPALQVSEEEWIDAARSYGQRPHKTMQKHMFPFVLPYLLIYASMTVGGVIITLAALSFIGQGLGITGAPSWGRAIRLGRPHASTVSWHTSFIPGVLIVVLVTGLNAFGDGVRDAIDPESEGGGEEEATAGGAAG